MKTEEKLSAIVEWVCMPAWQLAKKNPKKWVRVSGFVLSIPTIILFSIPVMFPFVVLATVADIWRGL